jgi:hypothetical protein
MVARIAALILAATLAGCAAHKLSVDEVKSFKLTSISVRFAPTTIRWSAAERAYAKSKGLPSQQFESVAHTEEAKAFLQARAAEKIKAALQNHVGPELIGTRPVRLDVLVQSLRFNAEIIGRNQMEATINVVDAQNGAALLSSTIAVSGPAQGALSAVIQTALVGDPPDPADQVIDRFGPAYARWLTKKR